MRETPILSSIPTKLNRKDVFILEGIRYAFNIIQLSYDTLFQELTIISKKEKEEKINSQHYYSIFKEAWAIIDFSWKLRNLIFQINSPDSAAQKELNEQSEKILNMEFFNKIRDFRNTFQHLDERIGEVIVQENDSVWGNISWIYVIDKQTIHSCLLYPGHPRTSSDIINPGGLRIESPVCHITLTSINRKRDKLKINISDFIRELDEFMQKFESIILNQFRNMDYSKRLAQDMIFRAEISFKKTKHNSI